MFVHMVSAILPPVSVVFLEVGKESAVMISCCPFAGRTDVVRVSMNLGPRDARRNDRHRKQYYKQAMDAGNATLHTTSVPQAANSVTTLSKPGVREHDADYERYVCQHAPNYGESDQRACRYARSSFQAATKIGRQRSHATQDGAATKPDDRGRCGATHPLDCKKKRDQGYCCRAVKQDSARQRQAHK
jgi:hypothetical protein